MSDDLLIGLAGLLAIGTAAQWLAWRLRLPSILLLLGCGFLAGPVTGFLNPDELLGDLLFPFVSLAVAVILFEGALGLSFAEIREVRSVVRKLISIGALITWFIASVAAHYILDLSGQLAVLLGAILIVSGPTVVGPLLRHVRPVARPNSVLKWEGILIDPIGVIVAVLVFEGITAGELSDPNIHAVQAFVETMLAGILIGLLGAIVIVIALRRYWIPDSLQNSVTLTVVVSIFTLSNATREESGLLAVVLMGVMIANQPWVSVHHIVDFKENLRALLLGTLFVLLAARLTMDNLGQMMHLNSLAFLALLIFFVRPLTVLVTTQGSLLTWRERALVAWVMPRGIVAAASSSTFALALVQRGFDEAAMLIPYTFMVIIGTVGIYGLTAAPVARWLGVARPNPQGTLIIGAHGWARQIARALMSAGFQVLMVDTNRANTAAARLEGIPTYYGSILAEYALDEINLDGIGRAVALTPNAEVNALAALRLTEVFDRSEVFQLPASPGKMQERENGLSAHLRGRYLFGTGMTYQHLSELFAAGAKVRTTDLTPEFDYDAFRAHHGSVAIPLFLIDEDGVLTVITEESAPRPHAGETIISIVTPSADDQSDSRRPRAPSKGEVESAPADGSRKRRQLPG